MTSTGIEVERTVQGPKGRPMSRALSSSVASGESFGILGANGAGQNTAVEKVPASWDQGGGQIRVRGFDPAEQRTRIRHLVIFATRVL
jgi:ABC-2 type transport system ATP-binding protein